MKALLAATVSLLWLASAPLAEPAQRGDARAALGKGEAKQALGALEAGALAAEKTGRWEEAADLYNKASHAARMSGQLQKAIADGARAFELGEKANQPFLQSSAALNSAYALRSVGQRAKAGEWLEKGLAAAKKIEPPQRRYAMQANLYREQGVDFLKAGETSKAIEYVSYARADEERRLALLKKARRANPKAISMTESSLLRTLHQLGVALDRADRPAEAVKTFEAGIGLAKQAGLKTPFESALYTALGELYSRQKDYPRALDNLKTALANAEKHDQAKWIQQASAGIAEIHLQNKRPAEAIRYYKRAIDSIESTRSLLESEEYRSSFFEDKRKTYAGMVLAHVQAKEFAAAFDYNERARSRAFLDILGSRVPLAHGPLLEEERALRARIAGLQARQARAAEAEAEIDEDEEAADRAAPDRELEAAQKAYNDFLARLKKENREQASLMSVEPLTLQATQELLPPATTMLEYFVTQNGVQLWVVEKDRMRFVHIPLARTDLLRQVGALRESVLRLGDQEKFRASSRELYRLLIQPALPHARGRDLLIVPHDALHYVPFQALLSAEGKYLIQDYPIYYLSSASLMQFTREKKRAGGERALVLGNPSLGDAAYDLRFAEREAKEVALVFPQSDVYVEAEASKPRAVSASPQYDILHFAVHAELDEEDPMSSALLLAGAGKDDGRLKVGEVFALDLKAGMVVLSACETGLGKLSNGDELIGLTRAFIYAGTPSVVTTLWKVNDRASYELMREFYRHLKGGKKSEALRQAQLKTMERFPEPFYWAAYELTGEP